MVTGQQIRDLIQQFAQERFEAALRTGLSVEAAHRVAIFQVAETTLEAADSVAIDTEG
jgi:hypothetical protein